MSVASSRFLLHRETVSIETDLVASLSGGAGAALLAAGLLCLAQRRFA